MRTAPRLTVRTRHRSGAVPPTFAGNSRRISLRRRAVIDGPLEYLVLEFPGNQFRGEIGPALADVVEKGIIRIVDILIILKDDQGIVSTMELEQLDDELRLTFDPLVDDVRGMLSQEDVHEVSDLLADNSS